MGRYVQFDENAVCDECSTVGAYDFYGDYLCPICTEKLIDSEELADYTIE